MFLQIRASCRRGAGLPEGQEEESFRYRCYGTSSTSFSCLLQPQKKKPGSSIGPRRKLTQVSVCVHTLKVLLPSSRQHYSSMASNKTGWTTTLIANRSDRSGEKCKRNVGSGTNSVRHTDACCRQSDGLHPWVDDTLLYDLLFW